MDLLLRFKPWQLFVILLIPWVLSWFSSFTGIWDSLFLLIYVGWAYAIGIKMNALIPENKRPGVKLFKINFWLLVVFTVLVVNILVYTRAIMDNNTIFSIVFAAVFIYLILSIWMFAARMLESMIEGYVVNRSDALKGFFCFWFFPFGIWYIQPAVQRVLAKYEQGNPEVNLPG
ncbi:MAG: hypothetical protein M3O71_26045 [Bacteroidota bacterium]|nr:hypothetical protein [Bacteroidota bacterium]